VNSTKETAERSAPATILSVDYGRARIGLAIATAEARLARPLATLERVNRNEDMRRLRELAREHCVKQIVVGLPLLLDGTRGEMAEEAERFAQRVRKQIGLPVEMVDERLTSWEAERLLEEEFGKKYRDETQKKKNVENEKPTVDSVAAAVILREYLAKQEAAEGG
jgi:putative holliday junction resolvase